MTQDKQGGRIVSDPTIMMGKPVIQGTRIAIEHLLGLSATGHTVEDIVEKHPHLTTDDVRAAYAFAADLLRDTWLKGGPDATGSWQSDGPEWTTIELLN